MTDQKFIIGYKLRTFTLTLKPKTLQKQLTIVLQTKQHTENVKY